MTTKIISHVEIISQAFTTQTLFSCTSPAPVAAKGLGGTKAPVKMNTQSSKAPGKGKQDTLEYDPYDSRNDDYDFL